MTRITLFDHILIAALFALSITGLGYLTASVWAAYHPAPEISERGFEGG
jgi:hypothetical protein